MDRRRIIMSTQSGIAMLSLTWAVLVFTDRIQYWHVLVLAMLGGTIASFTAAPMVRDIIRRAGPILGVEPQFGANGTALLESY